MVLKLTTTTRYVLLVIVIIVSASVLTSVARVPVFSSWSRSRTSKGEGGRTSHETGQHADLRGVPTRSACTPSSASHTKTTAAPPPSKTSPPTSHGAPPTSTPYQKSTTYRTTSRIQMPLWNARRTRSSSCSRAIATSITRCGALGGWRTGSTRTSSTRGCS